jgi:hypothetical protein
VFPYTMIHEAGTQQRSAGGKFDLIDRPALPVA